jgi:IS1 family transposase
MAATATASVRRFEELIAGHPYLIEVVPVSQDRWRAYVVRIPGIPNAMMPFYGQTADEAASQLRQWLTRAYERAASSVRRV